MNTYQKWSCAHQDLHCGEKIFGCLKPWLLWPCELMKNERVRKSERLFFSSCQLMLSQMSTYRPSGHMATIRGYFVLKKHNMKEEGLSSRLSLCLLEWHEQEDLQRFREFRVISACAFREDNRENGQKYFSGVLRIDDIACNVCVTKIHFHPLQKVEYSSWNLICFLSFSSHFTFVFSVFNLLFSLLLL